VTDTADLVRIPEFTQLADVEVIPGVCEDSDGVTRPYVFIQLEGFDDGDPNKTVVKTYAVPMLSAIGLGLTIATSANDMVTAYAGAVSSKPEAKSEPPKQPSFNGYL
jgi:hypothetical protein